RGQIFDLLVGKILPRGENAAQENRSIDGGELAFFPTLPRIHVDEVVEETMLVGQIVGEKFQRLADSLENFLMLPVFALIADAQAGQAKSRGGDAGHFSRIISISQRAVFYLAGLLARLAPEEIERGALNLVEKLFVSSLVGFACGLNERIRSPLPASRQCGQRRGKQTHPADFHDFSSA